MYRALSVCALVTEGVLLHLCASRLPYSMLARVAAAMLVTVALVLAVWPAIRRRRSVNPVRNFRDLTHSDFVLLGSGGRWDVRCAEALMEYPELEPGDEPLRLSVSGLEQHLLILGMTGSGKTRMLEGLIAQAVARGEAVVVIDPKGDERLLQIIRAVCGHAGRSENFIHFALPHFDRSVRYNPVGSFVNAREVADRIAALLPSEGEAQTFRSYAWEVIHTAAQLQAVMGECVTVRALKRDAIDEPWEAVRRGVEWATRGAVTGPDGERLAKTYDRWVREKNAVLVEPLQQMIALARRPREHYQKMVAALVPVLAKLSALPHLEGDGLSWQEVARGRVVYFELGTLLGGESASAVAKMALLDLQSFVGRRYAYEPDRSPINVFVDEAADVVTPEFVNLLNKGRGAGIRLTLCAQTSSDFEAALGSRARANQIAGNVGTIVQFRAQNDHDARTFSELAGERRMAVRSEGERYEPALFSSGLGSVEDFRASFSTQKMWRSEPLVPPWALMDLPRFCYFAKLPDRIVLGRSCLWEVEDASADDVGRGGHRGERAGMGASS